MRQGCFRGILSLPFSFSDTIPSRYFLCVIIVSLPTILADFHWICCLHAALCFAILPSPILILSVIFVMLPFSMSSFVNRTLSMYSFFLDFQFLSMSPVYEYFCNCMTWYAVYNVLVLLTQWSLCLLCKFFHFVGCLRCCSFGIDVVSRFSGYLQNVVRHILFGSIFHQFMLRF